MAGQADSSIDGLIKGKLKILCIHGYRQNGNVFKEKLGAFRKLIKNKAELTFVDAPIKVKDVEDESADNNLFGWWFSRPDDSFDALEASEYCQGFDESLKVISTVATEQGPFDGILGFSQGAALVALLCSLHQSQKLDFDFKFAIIVAGFKSLCSAHQQILKEQIALKTLHVFGENDKVIPKAMSEELSSQFISPVVVVHSGGHFLPVTSQQKSHYITFLDSCLN